MFFLNICGDNKCNTVEALISGFNVTFFMNIPGKSLVLRSMFDIAF